MYRETRHKAIIALSFLIAVGWVNYYHYEKPVEAGVLVFVCAFPLLYAAYYVLHVLGWIAFDGETGSGLRLIPRISAGIAWIFRTIYGAIAAVFRGLWYGVRFIARTTKNAHERRKWEQGRPERERQAAESEKAERLRMEEERRQREIDDENAHKRRVAREAELTEARAKAELSARLAMQEEANRLAREHEQHMLSVEQERLSIAEKRGKRHEALLGTLSDLVEKSKG